LNTWEPDRTSLSWLAYIYMCVL